MVHVRLIFVQENQIHAVGIAWDILFEARKGKNALDVRLICFQDDGSGLEGAVLKTFEYLSFMTFHIHGEKVRLLEARMSVEYLFKGESRYGYGRLMR